MNMIKMQLNQQTSKIKKLTISIVYDIFDFIINGTQILVTLLSGGMLAPLIPIIGTIYDFIGLYIGVKLYGIKGWFNLWEIIEVSNVIDMWVPTMTALWVYENYYTSKLKTTESKTDKLINYCKGKFKSTEEIDKCIKTGG